jgi:hypothetical protein
MLSLIARRQALRQIKKRRWKRRILICTQTGAALCISTYIETKAALGTSTLWAKATIRGSLTW